MEYIDIFDENNNPTGQIKEKRKAHEEGDFHRTAHGWIINDKNEYYYKKEVRIRNHILIAGTYLEQDI